MYSYSSIPDSNNLRSEVRECCMKTYCPHSWARRTDFDKIPRVTPDLGIREPGRRRKSPLGYFCTLNNTPLMVKDKEQFHFFYIFLFIFYAALDFYADVRMTPSFVEKGCFGGIKYNRNFIIKDG